ncbi:hypothetical protein O6H91_01G039900 [Diphasiastrum complanatum]|uniref:Uncharacterized protein n=1 Tax=Diphasiastrum complanatum TaxID=34168 RepID=A0ACC2EQ32_DIPCM|nr:hypothetical protein O6H91_01G039900 [Diphasiastrum complanatum]
MADDLDLQQLAIPVSSLEPLFDFNWYFGFRTSPVAQTQQSPTLSQPSQESSEDESCDSICSEASKSPTCSTQGPSIPGSGNLRTIESSLSVPDDELSSDTEELQRVFDAFDENKDGKLSREDLGRSLEKLGLNLSEQELMAIVMEVDKNGNGFVDLEEFLALYSKDVSNLEEPEEEYLKETFQIFDKNKDGFISAEELQHMMCNMGFAEGTNVVDCRHMIKGVDRDGDGLVDFMDFKHMMCTNTHNCSEQMLQEG